MNIDFERKIFSGVVSNQVEITSEKCTRLYFDLKVIEVKTVEINGVSAGFSIYKDDHYEALGAQLRIPLERTYLKGEKFTVTITYQTLNNSETAAMNWLTPE